MNKWFATASRNWNLKCKANAGFTNNKVIMDCRSLFFFLQFSFWLYLSSKIFVACRDIDLNPGLLVFL